MWLGGGELVRERTPALTASMVAKVFYIAAGFVPQDSFI